MAPPHIAAAAGWWMDYWCGGPDRGSGGHERHSDELGGKKEARQDLCGCGLAARLWLPPLALGEREGVWGGGGRLGGVGEMVAGHAPLYSCDADALLDNDTKGDSCGGARATRLPCRLACAAALASAHSSSLFLHLNKCIFFYC